MCKSEKQQMGESIEGAEASLEKGFSDTEISDRK